MRLWHESLISKLPRQQLLGQHRECCALRGAGWGRKHSVVDYVFTHVPERLIAYHWHIMDEMEYRGYKPDRAWDNPNYRGKVLGIVENWADEDIVDIWHNLPKGKLIYPEHNDEYLKECIDNLKSKGIDINEDLGR